MGENVKRHLAYCFNVTSNTGPLGFLVVPKEGRIPLGLYISIDKDAFFKEASQDYSFEESEQSAGNILANLPDDPLLFCSAMIRFHDPSTGVQIVQVSWINSAGRSVSAYFELRVEGHDMIICRANSFESIGADANASIARASYRKAQLAEVIPDPEKSALPDQAPRHRPVYLPRT
ncbi:hypothetical protein SOM22_17175 [Stenotrophomonas rhizophila]|uniref:hypothetical protein n=1 Tax=Stenotrophomonas rhizophila TaxID=216778 RepID=UPI0028AB13C8|nr:hypothetical protein [Stenotrophomonas rhizophila]MDY0956312.1 hypothetical protein [Stenotrophomonas rhizophila]